MKLPKNGIGPQPGPQEEFMRSPADIAIYGGAAGGGKSFALVLEAGRNTNVPGFAGIVFRRTSPELTGGGSIWEESGGVYPHLGGAPAEYRLRWNFPTGDAARPAQVEFSHLQHKKDVHNHQGKQYAFIGFDELTHFEESQFWYMVSRNRSVSGVKPYIRAATNPDPDSWVRRFIDWWIDEDGSPIADRSGVLRWFVRLGDVVEWADTKEELLDRFPDKTALSVTFIPAKLDDNPALLRKDPEYRAKLDALPRIERERLLGGNWDVRATAGMYFQRGYFEIVDAPPAHVVDRVRAWDKAATKPSETNPDPDWTSGVKLSRTADGVFYVEHVARFREAPLGVEQQIRNIAEQDGYGCKVGLWQDPGGAGKADADHFVRLLLGYATRVERAAKDKETYAKPVSAQAERGNIKVVRGPWNDAFLHVLEGFPEGPHDDDVDALSLAFMLLVGSGLSALRALAKM